MAIAIGTRFGRFEILSLLGAGGMGEVYLALDTRLGRKVALKLLPPLFTKDKDRLRRFEQEARATSALNHPNIITIHEIGEIGDAHFIVTEFIEGETLRQHLLQTRTKLPEALGIALQAVGALASAHAIGIVHRDVKPENIMLRPDGYVKVLDFGLALLVDHPLPGPDTSAPTAGREINLQVNLDQHPTIDLELTDATPPGAVIGTVKYMSPEQARGSKLDARSDLFSLGIVLYEMVAGIPPFTGATTADVIVSILEKEPLPLVRHWREVPAELERIVTKALAKDREERYQTARDLLIDLKQLKQQLELEAAQERFARPELSQEQTVSIPLPEAAPTKEPNAQSQVVEPAPAATSAEDLIGEVKRRKGGMIAALTILAMAIAGIGYGLYKSFRGDPPPSRLATAFGWIEAGSLKMEEVAKIGPAVDAVISPDGKYIVYVKESAGQQSLQIRHIATNADGQVVPPSEARYWGLTFSHDSNYLYYNYNVDQHNPVSVLYKTPIPLESIPRKVLTQIDSPVTLSPDDKRLAFIRDSGQGESLLIVANVDGTGEQKLASRLKPDWLGWPAWSPQRNVIACPVRKLDATGDYYNVVEVQVDGGAERVLSSERWGRVGRMAWLADSGSLLMAAPDQAVGSSREIWQLSYCSGEARKVINDLNNYLGLSLTADSRSLVTVSENYSSEIWLVPSGDAGRATQITSRGSKYASFTSIAWTPDGQLVYGTKASGKLDLWSMEPDGSNQKQLTFDGQINASPAVSANGRYIVFVSDRHGGTPHIWRMDSDGSNPVRLTSGGIDSFPSCSPDNHWVVYRSWRSGRPTLWRVPIDGGEEVQLTHKYSDRPAISPDGKLIACSYWDEQPDSRRGIGIVPFEGGKPIKILDIPNPDSQVVRWTHNGQALTYIENRSGVSNIWSRPLAGGSPKQLTDFTAEQIFWFDWSREGKYLACARGVRDNDVVLIRRP